MIIDHMESIKFYCLLSDSDQNWGEGGWGGLHILNWDRAQFFIDDLWFYFFSLKFESEKYQLLWDTLDNFCSCFVWQKIRILKCFYRLSPSLNLQHKSNLYCSRNLQVTWMTKFKIVAYWFEELSSIVSLNKLIFT